MTQQGRAVPSALPESHPDRFYFWQLRHFYSLNISPTLRPSLARKITSPNRLATERTISLSPKKARFSGGIGTVSVVTNSLTGKAPSLSAELSDRIGWTNTMRSEERRVGKECR